MTRNLIKAAAAAVLALSCAACTENKGTGIELLPEEAFAKTVDGKNVAIYTLTNSTTGMTAQLTNYGARLVQLWVPSTDGFKDVVWGYDSIDAYLNAGDKYSGPVVGRYGNRIKDGKFTLDGKEYQLTVNENGNQLHGGAGGFSTKVWDAEQFTDADGNPAVKMTLVSDDGEEGYPGKLTISVTYTLKPANELVIDYTATTDAPTVLNPTSHVYYNLHGTSSKSTDSHLMTIYADSFTLTDSELIPTGEIAPVEGTPMDFRTATAIGARIDTPDYEPLAIGKGYDHNWVLNKHFLVQSKQNDALKDGAYMAAQVYEPSTGIVMTVYTDQPGLQFYAGQGMDGKEIGKRGEIHNVRSGIALEAQNFPDAPNHENFPSSVLRPGETYTQHTIYAFAIQ